MLAWPGRGLCVRKTSRRCGEEWLHSGHILQVVLPDLLIDWLWGVSEIKKLRLTARVLADVAERMELADVKMLRN